ncbi:MAG: VanW family protein [Thermoleophilia bacterium]|nr:VanW family protein [Thermoleophilia bacterium]
MRAGASSTAALRRRDLAGPLRAFLIGVAAVSAAGLALGLAFAGSPARIAEGVHVAGVDVGGLTASEARALLERRFARLQATPVTFVAGTNSFDLTPAQLGVKVDWAAAVETARREGEGFGPVRGFRRIHTRIFGAEIVPATEVSAASLDYALGEIAREVERPARDASIRLEGLRPVLVSGLTGQALDRAAAEQVVARALSTFVRTTVGLPVRITTPAVTGQELRRALAQTRTALSGPVRLRIGKTGWRLTRQRLAGMLVLPAEGRSRLSIGGRHADRFLDRIAERVARPPVDAGFQIRGDGSVRVVSGVYGRELARAATAEAILAAAVSPADRVAVGSTRSAPPERTTAEARAMGITSQLVAYSTAYAGSADRIHNLQLAISLLDGTLVAPGGTFSLNDAVGERTAERGFRKAPVIIGNEYEEDIGGGVSQVATTVFNAAWEAGLKVAERNPHALYIGRYPLGRDATVNYPDLDLKFVNDTAKWILVKGWSTDSGIAVSLYGAPTGRRVVSSAGPLTVRGGPPVERIADPDLPKGRRVVEEEGEPPRSVTVTRKVYLPNGELLYDETWTTNYRGEKRVVRIGTMVEEKDEEEAAKPEPPPPGR